MHRSPWFLLLACVFVTACPDGEPPASQVPEQTPQPSNQPDQTPAPTWDSLLAGLNGEATTPSPTPVTTGPQLFGGESGIILTNPAHTSLGGVYTTNPATPNGVYVETWASFDTVAMTLPPGTTGTNLDLYALPTGGTTSETAFLTKYCGLDATDPRTLSVATERFSYLPFPSTASINGLLTATAPPTTGTMTYDVFTLQPPVPPATTLVETRTGALYREVRTNNAGQVEWSDFWVLYDGYVFPTAGYKTELRPAATPYTRLYDYLNANQTARQALQPDRQAMWRYVPIMPIVFAPPTCPPPTP